MPYRIGVIRGDEGDGDVEEQPNLERERLDRAFHGGTRVLVHVHQHFVLDGALGQDEAPPQHA